MPLRHPQAVETDFFGQHAFGDAMVHGVGDFVGLGVGGLIVDTEVGVRHEGDFHGSFVLRG